MVEMQTSNPDDWGVLSQLPGNPLMWVLILSELLVFGGLLLAFAVARALHPDIFAAGQAALDVWLGGLNTLVLVTSGWLAARAVNGIRPRWNLLAAGLLGVVFLCVKAVEWNADIAAGHGLESNAFWTLYFLITGFHAAHVVFGLVVLAIVGRWNSKANLETGIAFWHMVDLIWLMVFPAFYLSH